MVFHPEMKYRCMAAHRGEHRVEKMAENLGFTRSGFYAWLSRGRAARQAADEHLRELIEGIQEEVHYRYGSPRVTRERKEVALLREDREKHPAFVDSAICHSFTE